jgi:hypothetical protein
MNYLCFYIGGGDVKVIFILKALPSSITMGPELTVVGASGVVVPPWVSILVISPSSMGLSSCEFFTLILPLGGEELLASKDCSCHSVNVFVVEDAPSGLVWVLPEQSGEHLVVIIQVESIPKGSISFLLGQPLRVE